MSISPELTKEIEKEISGLTKSDFRRPGGSINKFIGEFSSTLAQAAEDMDMLVKTGFDASRMPKYNALLEMFSMAYGERIGSVQDTPEKRVRFDAQMALAEKDRKMLGVVCAHIAEKSGSKKAQQNYRFINKGSGIIDTLTDNLGLAALVKEFPQLAAEIKPGAYEINAKYLEEVVSRAVELLQMKGIVVEQGVPQSVAVERQNRLLTLCLNAQSYIKKYAYAAYFDNMDYYNSNYASAGPKPAEVEAAAA